MSLTDHVMTALQLDKVFEAGGVTIEDLRQENASKVRVHRMFSRILNLIFAIVFSRKNDSYIGIS
jgi:hypothetical protein